MPKVEYTTTLYVDRKVKKKPHKPYKVTATCHNCKQPITDFETFNIYETWTEVYLRCKEKKICPNCLSKLIFEAPPKYTELIPCRRF